MSFLQQTNFKACVVLQADPIQDNNSDKSSVFKTVSYLVKFIIYL